MQDEGIDFVKNFIEKKNITNILLVGQAAREGETALHAPLGTGGFQNTGVDQLYRGFLALRTAHVDDHHPAQHTHLGRGQTDAVSGAHGFGHIVKQGVDAGGDLLYGTGNLSECGVTEFNDL